MNSRTKKWKRYRKQIAKTPINKFSQRKAIELNASSIEDNVAIKETSPSRGAISMAGIGGKSYHSPLYKQYKTRQKVVFILNLVLLLLAIVGLIILYFYWVKE